MINRKRVCVVTGNPDRDHVPARYARSITSLVGILQRAGCELTLLAYGLDAWSDLDVDTVDLASFPTERELGARPLGVSYKVYEWLKLHPFEAVVFPDFFGPAYVSLHAKRAGLHFGQTTLAVLRCGALLDELARRAAFPSTTEHVAVAHMERISRAWADLIFAPSRAWLEMPAGGPLASSVVIPLHAAARDVPRDGTAPREVVFWGNGTGHATGIVCSALETLTPRARQLRFTFLWTEPVSAGTHHEVERRAAEEVNYTVMTTSDREAALQFLVATHATAIVLPPTGFSFDSADCLARGIPFASIGDPCLDEWLAPPSHHNVIPGPVTRDAIRTLIERIAREPWPLGVPRHGEDELHLQQDLAVAALFAARPSPPVRTPRSITVCMSHHNRPAFLRLAIESLLAQTTRDFEVVLVDDGSFDPDALAYLDTLEPIFAERGWKIIRQQNSYLGAARNRAVREATHEYVLFMDDDNIAMPHELETLARTAAASGADLLLCRAIGFSGSGGPDVLTREAHMPLGGVASIAAIRNTFGDANALVRKSAFEAVGGFTTDYGVGYEDWELFSRFALAGLQIVLVPEELYYYRVLDTSMLHTTDDIQSTYRAMRPYLEANPMLHDLLLLAQGYHRDAQHRERSVAQRIQKPVRAIKQLATKVWARLGPEAKMWRG